MDNYGILALERIDEITRMCDREQPIYEQIGNFSIALYVFGYFPCQDLLSADDIDNVEAGVILKEHFDKIEYKDIPENYYIATSSERYLLVIGDPVFPTHFAVVADMQRARSYFSKLPFFGCGFDSFEELKNEFSRIEDLSEEDIAYYRLKKSIDYSHEFSQINTVKSDAGREFFKYEYAT